MHRRLSLLPPSISRTQNCWLARASRLANVPMLSSRTLQLNPLEINLVAESKTLAYACELRKASMTVTRSPCG